MKTFYFTATGNNLYIAKQIGGELYSIPKMIKSKNFHFSDEKIGLVFPVYALSVPPIVEIFLQKTKLESDYIFAILSYGNIAGGAVSHLVNIGHRYSIEFSFIDTILMVDNYLPIYYMEKQITDEPNKKIDENLECIISDINRNKKYIQPVSGIDKLKTKIISKVWSKIPTLSKKFSVEDNCNYCSTCVKVCPVNNVRLKGEKPKFLDYCINCLACTHACPQNVIRLRNEKSKERFRNQHIELKEIIESNE